MQRIKVSITWFDPVTGRGSTLSVETFDLDGNRLSCAVLDVTPNGEPIERLAKQVAAAVLGQLPLD